MKVADFGIAKVAGQATELTMTGSVVGSPHYLSPEQMRGEDLDGRTDVFSLGVVLYELLGQRPFDGETLTTLVYQILHQEPPPISELRADLAPPWTAAAPHAGQGPRAALPDRRRGRRRDRGPGTRYFGPERLAQAVLAPDTEIQGTRMMAASGQSPVSAPSPSLAVRRPPSRRRRRVRRCRRPEYRWGPSRLGHSDTVRGGGSRPAPAKRSALPIILALVGVLVIGGAIGLYLLLGKLVFKPKPPEIGKKDPNVATQVAEPEPHTRRRPSPRRRRP